MKNTLDFFYVFGNPLLPFDSLPIKLVPKLQKSFPQIDFIIFDPNENLKPRNNKLCIIDSVEGIDKVTQISDVSQIETDRVHSLHDFDLGFNLKLLKKIGELKEIIIIGVPTKEEDEEKVFREIEKIIIALE